MNDFLILQVTAALGHIDDNRQDCSISQRGLCSAMRTTALQKSQQIAAPHQLHDYEIVLTTLAHANVLYDIVMHEAAHQECLLMERIQRVWCSNVITLKQIECFNSTGVVAIG